MWTIENLEKLDTEELVCPGFQDHEAFAKNLDRIFSFLEKIRMIFYEIISKEIAEGQSWLRIRNQFPCNACNYQWLCPSPSDYETAIGRPNLCHVK